MINMKTDEMTVVGRIVAPHGVRGDLRVLPEIDKPEIFKNIKHIYFGEKSYKVISSRPHKNIYIMKVEGVTDRNTSESMVGLSASLSKDEIPPCQEGEYYCFELLDMEVYTQEGTFVGILKEIIETGANDVYTVIGLDKEEIYLPAIPSCIKKVDVESRKMTVELPEWA